MEEERAQVWCVRYERPPLSIYSTRMVGLGVDKLRNHLGPSLHDAIQPLEKREAERAWGWCGRTPASLPHHHLAHVGSWLVLGLCHGSAWSGWISRVGLFLFPLSGSALRFL